MKFRPVIYFSLATLALAVATTPPTALGESKAVAPTKVSLPSDRAASPRLLQDLQQTSVSTENATLVFSAPPRESAEEGARIYQPIADYLSRAIGREIVYKHPGDWLSYQTTMQKGGYDLVFDGPHFNSWRISNLRHNTLVRLAEDHQFAVIVRKDNADVSSVKQLAGKSVCAMTPPNLGTLTLQRQFDNPARQPLIVNTRGWRSIFEGVASGRCVAGVIPTANLEHYDRKQTTTRTIFTSDRLPNQALSAGPRLKTEEQHKLTAALIAPGAKSAIQELLRAFGSDRGFTMARPDEYTGVDHFLKDVWGYARR